VTRNQPDPDFMHAGKLVTVFSAPDYPQHQARDERFENKASVLQLKAPSYSDFDVPVPFSAVPRPPAPCFYDLDLPGSDDELNLGADDAASDVSEGFASSVATSVTSIEVADDDATEDMDTEEVSGMSVVLPEAGTGSKDSSMEQGSNSAAGTTVVHHQRVAVSAPVPAAENLGEVTRIEAPPNSCADVQAAAQPAGVAADIPPDPNAVVADDMGDQGDVEAALELKKQRSVGSNNGDLSSTVIACVGP
jgi:hypothetical protein